MPFFWAAVASSWEPQPLFPCPPTLFCSFLSLLPTCLPLAGRVPGRRGLSLAPHCSEDCSRDAVMSLQGMWPEVSGPRSQWQPPREARAGASWDSWGLPGHWRRGCRPPPVT